MEAKVSARSTKKSAGGSGTSSERKKSRKKKKDKRKPSLQSLRGADSKDSDAISPDCDSEVQAEGDNVQTDQGESAGSATPVGQVTKLPLLGAQTSVSLITQTVSTSYSVTPLTATTGPATTTTARVTTTAATPTTTTTMPAEEGSASRVAQSTLTVAKRPAKVRSKGQSSKSGNTKSSRTRDRPAGGKGGTPSNSSTNPSTSKASGDTSSTVNESLRWDFVLEDTEQERERIALYKMNRRKRYLKDAQAKGLAWAVNYTTTAASPLSEDSGVETGGSPRRSYVDYAPMHSLRPMGAHRPLAEAFVEC